MSNLIAVTPTARHAFALLFWIAEASPARMTIDALAEATRTSYAQSARLLRVLAKARIVTSTRGPGGGWRLSVPPHCISLLQIVEVFRHNGADADSQERVSESKSVSRGTAVLDDLLRRDETAVRRILASTSLADALVAERSPESAPRHREPDSSMVGSRPGESCD